jgi:hypothetical protein
MHTKSGVVDSTKQLGLRTPAATAE